VTAATLAARATRAATSHLSPAEKRGLGLVLISAVAYGAMPILAKWAYAGGASRETLLGWRFLMAAALFVLLAPRGGEALPLRKRFVLWGLGAIFVGNAYCYFTALQTVPASLLSLVLYTYPVIVTLLSAAAGQEALRARSLVAGAMAFAGCGLAAFAGAASGGSWLGIGMAFGSASIYSIYIVLSGHFAQGVSTEAASRHVAQAAAAIFGLEALFKGELLVALPVSAWLSIAAVGLVCTVVALQTFLAGVALIGPGRAAVASSFEVIVTLGLAAAVLGEGVGLKEILGAALILGGVALHNLAPRRRVRPGLHD
jgi:drug/metabolite transporter (DMT)-like permease